MSAVTDLTLTTQQLSSDDWTAEGVSLTIQPTDQGAALQLDISKFELKSLSEVFGGVAFSCPQLREDIDAYHCDLGKLSIKESPYGAQQAVASLSYYDPGHFSITIDGLIFAEGRLALSFEMESDIWHLKLSANQLLLESLRRVLKSALPLRDWEVNGRLSIQSEISGSAQGVQHIAIQADIAQLNYSNLDGLQVAEDGGGQLEISANQKDEVWSGSIAAQLKNGQFYSDPFYLDFTPEPLHLKLDGRWSPAQKKVTIERAIADLSSTIKISGEAIVDLNRHELMKAKIQLDTDHLDELYKTGIQPVLIGSIFDELDASGALQADLELTQGRVDRVQASLDGVNLDDKRGLFALGGLNGKLSWSRQGKTESSHIEIEKGQIYRIPFSTFAIHAQAEEQGISLLKPIDLPLLNGHIQIAEFKSHNFMSDSPTWQTSAVVKNLSLQRLAKAFEWPPMSGELNGKLPAMHYQEQTLTFDGALQVDVFGGRIQVGQLKVKQPFGRVPELFAAAELSGLDLEKITQTFSFGHIEGGLEGWVRDLHLIDWEPVRFDALFHSPEDDNLAHRISQRAVDNLTSIGNGIGSGLQNTFLGIFEQFRYNRIQLSAKLEGNLAELDGIDHSDGGYYLVKGAGLPRIDVIARNRRVAWKTLVERLKNIRVEGMEVR